MKAVVCLAVLFAATPVGRLFAACQDGKVVTCRIGKKTGTRECINGKFTPCSVEDDAPPEESGTVAPRYFILSVIYAPPGTQGGGSRSSVSYGTGSSTGSTVSSANSFKQKYKVTATVGGEFPTKSFEIGTSFSYQRATTNTSALEIKKNTTTEISVPGPAVDGLDHDRDQIWLWLNPKVNLRVSPASASWTLQDTGTADIQFVFVGHLKNPSLMPPGVAERLQSAGITPADYPAILSANPFATGSPVIDPERYVPLHTTFPYQPPFAPGDPATTLRTTISTATTNTLGKTKESEYEVGLTIEGSLGFRKFYKAAVKSENEWTWTSSNTQSASTSTSESASVAVGGPAFGYTGPTDMAVYYDVLYKTFLFAPVTGTPQFKGVVTSRSGRKTGGLEVVIKAGGKTYRTFTDTKGQYRIFEKPAGAIQVKVGRVTASKATVQLP